MATNQTDDGATDESTDNHAKKMQTYQTASGEQVRVLTINRPMNRVTLRDCQVGGEWEMPLDRFEEDLNDGDLTAVDEQVVADHEVVIDRRTLAELADSAAQALGTTDDVDAAVEQAYDALGHDPEN